MRERYESYAFSDHSDDPYEEYTIKDGELVSLFELCAKYSKIVALSFLPGDEKLLARLSTYAVDESETGIFQNQRRIVGEIYVDGTRLTEKYYHVGPGLLQTLLEISEYDLFNLAHFGNSKPENPVFFALTAAFSLIRSFMRANAIFFRAPVRMLQPLYRIRDGGSAHGDKSFT